MDAHHNIFSVSPKVIWLSSVFMGILASIPKILQLGITFTELLTDASIAFLFSLSIWYYNLYAIPKFSVLEISRAQLIRYLVLSLVLGIVLMLGLVLVHQMAFPKYTFFSMLLMYQFRGILINLTIFMFIHFLYQNYHTQQAKLQMEKIKAENLNAQYELLKQQVNPHFLFNSLNTLKSMIDIQDAEASDFVVNLSDFYRFSLENRRDNLFFLHKEIDVLEAYVFLLKSRFEEGILIEIDINESLKNTYIPPFTLQLLIENCIKHNIVSIIKPLHIRLFAEQDYLVISNNCQLKNNERSSGIGLTNIRGRYAYFSSREVEIIETGACFTVKLPLIYEYTDC